ncbi:MAG TPA: cyclase family protein, partial [bacterium]|nr:cyclase family protein [bacterium]
EGKLSAHHVFWGVPQGSHDIHLEVHSRKTITEMIYVDNSIADGNYFINIQIPNFVADAAPSRILMYQAQLKNQLLP